MKVTCMSDGGARKKTEVAGAGAVVYDEDGTELAARAKVLQFPITVPQTEYIGLILALSAAVELGATDVEVLMDAELIVRQVNGEYATKNAKLVMLRDLALHWARAFDSCTIREFPKGGPTNKRRHGNVRADGLANEAMDRQENIG